MNSDTGPQDLKQLAGAGASPRAATAPSEERPLAKKARSRSRRISVAELQNDSSAVERLEKYGVKAGNLRETRSTSNGGTLSSDVSMRATRAKEVSEIRDLIIEDHDRPVVSAAEVLASLQKRDLGLDKDGFPLESARGIGDLLGKEHFRLPFVHRGRNYYDLTMLDATAEEKEATMAFFRTLPKEALREMITPSPLMQRLADEAATAEAAAAEGAKPDAGEAESDNN